MNGNFNAKCLETNGYCGYTKGKIYKIRDGKFTYDDFNTMGTRIDNIVDLDRNSGAIWELVEEDVENKMEDLRKLIEPCYVVVHMDDKLSKVEINSDNEKIISGDTHWCNLHSLSKELIGYNGDSRATIKEIYGYSEYNNLAYKLSIEGRPLIWKREEEPIKSPTQLEIESIELEQRKLADRLAKLKENVK